MREKVIVFVILTLVIVAVCLECGCNGNSATVKPSNKLDTDLKTSLENQQAMKETIKVLQGNLTKIQQSISNVVNTIVTKIEQRFETFQDSISQKIGEVGRDVNTKTSKSSNTTFYGIGLVAVVLTFALALIWMVAKRFGG